MRVQSRVVPLAVGFLLAAVMACGGAGGGGAQGGGDPDAGPALPFAQREQVMQRIEAAYAPLVASGDPARWEKLVTFARSQPEIAAARAKDDVLWARLTDGSSFLFLDNWQRPGAAQQPTRAAPPLPLAQRNVRAAAAGGPELPLPASGAPTAALLRLTASEFDSALPLFARVGAMLSARGWKLGGSETLSLESLSALPPVGVLFLVAHGAVAGENEDDYVVVTETEVSVASEQALHEDLAQRRLVPTRVWEGGANGRPAHYALTSAGVAKYMRLTPHSLVVLFTCNGGTSPASRFVEALHAAGAGSIVAWNGPANAAGFDSIAALFDRLTGANQVLAVQPPNRPFPFENVWSWLDAKGLLLNPPGEHGEVPTPILHLYDDFALAMPSITSLETAWKDTLVIHGVFGSVAGEVSVGGQSLAVKSWAAERIEVTLPTGASGAGVDPAGSLGDVVVSVRGLRSNARPLTSYRLPVTQVVKPSGTSFQTREVFQLHFRADVNATRDEVDGQLLDPYGFIAPASDGYLDYVASGTISSGGSVTATLSGSGRVPMTGPPNNTGEVTSGAVAYPVTRHELDVGMLYGSTDHDAVLTVPPSGTYPQSLFGSFDQYDFGAMENVIDPWNADSIPMGFHVALRADRSLAGRSKDVTGAAASVHVEWPDAAPSPPSQSGVAN